MIFLQPTNYQEALRIIIQSVHPHEVLYQGEAARSAKYWSIQPATLLVLRKARGRLNCF
jgi:hypothetical protein